MDYAEQLKAAQTTITITPAPLILEKVGATWRGMYLGLRTFSKTDPNTGEVKILPVAHFYDGAGVLFNMGTQMVHSVAVLRPGTSIEIALREMKPNKGKEGKTKIYSISPLDIPVANMNELFGGMLNISAPAPQDLLQPPSNNGNGHAPAKKTPSTAELLAAYGNLMIEAAKLAIEAYPIHEAATDEEIISAGRMLRALVRDATGDQF